MTSLTRSLAVGRVGGHRATDAPGVARSSPAFVSPMLLPARHGRGTWGLLVDCDPGDGLGVPYLTFVATGLIAATAMQTGAGDGAFPVMAGIKWRKEFHGAITTPLSRRQTSCGAH